MHQHERTSRRRFLSDSMAAVAAVGAIPAMTLAKPSTRPGGELWTIACRDAHLGQVGEPDAWSAMRAIGVQGVEVSVGDDLNCPLLPHPQKKYGIANPDQMKELADELAARKLKITAFCLHNQFDERPDKEVELATKTAQAAMRLGVPAIRLDVAPRKIQGEEEFLRFAIDIGKRIIRETGDANVRFGVENHGGTTNQPEFLAKLFEGVGSDRFGLTLDTANFYWFGHPLSKLYEIYGRFARSVCHTHCKNIKYPQAERDKQRPVGWEYRQYCCPVYEGDIDFKRLAQILRKGGYTGDLCIENESLGRFPNEQRREVLTREVEFLRQIAEMS